jgi:two-component system, cell cycle sensor histidine kinase and response regulator CckA
MGEETKSRNLSHAGSSLGRDALWIASIALVYFAAARLSLSLEIQPEDIATIWPPTGIFLSAILLTRRNLRPWLVGVLFFTDLLTEKLAGTSLPVSAIYALALSGDAVLSVWLLNRFVGEPITFRRVREVVGWLALSVVFSNALMSLAAAAAAGLLPGTHSFWNSWRWWAASDGVGNLLVTPFILTWATLARTKFGPWNPKRVLECALLFIPMSLLVCTLLGRVAGHSLFMLLLPYTIYPFMLWAALRFGVCGAATAPFIVAAITIALVLSGRVSGFSFAPGLLDDVMVAQLFFAIATVPMLFLAAVVTERKQSHAELRAEITERKQVEAALRESDERFRALFEQAGDYALVLDPAAKPALVILDTNEAACRIHGFTRSEMIGRSILELDPQVSEQRLGEMIRHVMAGETLLFETTHRRKDGSTFPVEVCANLVRIAGKPPVIFSIERDITERRRAEEEREKMQAQLNQSQKLESLGRLVGGIAHDFNNLLTVINGRSGLALQHLKVGDPLRTALAEIQHAGGQAASLTGQLLAFSRKQIVDFKLLNCNDLIAANRDMWQRLVGENVALVTAPAPVLGKVMADPGQLSQVLLNLIVNAKDAMPEGGTITIATANQEVHNADSAAHPGMTPGAYVLVTFSDTGPGIAPEIQEHIFEPFFTTKPVGKGTGLGLSTAYGIVQQCGGWIEVDSQRGRGATFRVYLPRVERTEDSVRVARPAMLGGTETVLVVEDQDGVRALARDVLKNAGYQVLEAANGGDALLVSKTHSGPIHLILTDVIMPGMDGLELARRLQPLRPEAKVLFTSGYTGDVIDHRGLRDPGVASLQKPFTPESLIGKVRETLDRSSVRPSILVADDSAPIRKFFTAILEGSGYSVLQAADRDEAVAHLRNHRVGVALVDLNMPGQEGFEAVKEVRSNHPEVRIVLISGAFTDDSSRECEAWGVDAVLAKPISPERLLEVVGRLAAS